MVCFIAVVWNQAYNIRGRPIFNAYCNQLDAMVLSMAPTQCFAPKCWLNSYWIKLNLHHLHLNFLWFLDEKYFYLMLSHKLTRGSVKETTWKHSMYSMLHCFSHVRLCVTLWTITHLAPLSMGFSQQEY